MNTLQIEASIRIWVDRVPMCSIKPHTQLIRLLAVARSLDSSLTHFTHCPHVMRPMAYRSKRFDATPHWRL